MTDEELRAMRSRLPDWRPDTEDVQDVIDEMLALRKLVRLLLKSFDNMNYVRRDDRWRSQEDKKLMLAEWEEEIANQLDALRKAVEGGV